MFAGAGTEETGTTGNLLGLSLSSQGIILCDVSTWPGLGFLMQSGDCLHVAWGPQGNFSSKQNRRNIALDDRALEVTQSAWHRTTLVKTIRKPFQIQG